MSKAAYHSLSLTCQVWPMTKNWQFTFFQENVSLPKLLNGCNLLQEVLSPAPSPYCALCAHVTPLWKPSSLHTTLANLMSTSSSQTVPQVLLCSTSTRPSLGSRAKLPAKRTLAADARGALRWLDELRRGSARAGEERDSSRRTKLKQRVRVIVAERRGSAGTKRYTWFNVLFFLRLIRRCFRLCYLFGFC